MALLLLVPTLDEQLHVQPRPLPRPRHRVERGDQVVHAARELGRHADGGAPDHSHRLRPVRHGHGVRGLRAARERAGAEPGHRPAPRLERGADRTARRPRRARQRRHLRAVGRAGRARRHHAGRRFPGAAVLGPGVGSGRERVRSHGRVMPAAAAPARLAPGLQVDRRCDQPRVVRGDLAALLVRVQPRRLESRAFRSIVSAR